MFIPWREGKSDAENMWHFIHEVYEIFLKLRSPGNLPRWLVEGLAQYGAYFVMEYEFPDLLPSALKYYSNYDSTYIRAEDYFSWGYGSLNKGIKRNTSDVLDWILNWGISEHDSKEEHTRYRVALEAFVHAFAGKRTPMELINMLEVQGGIDKIRVEVEHYFH